MPQRFETKFEYPTPKFEYPTPHQGFWDYSTRTAYIFGSETQEDELISTLNHESLHWVIQRIFGKRVCIRFDKISKKVLDWDKKVYFALY